jgi:hypothetical protein
MSAASATWEDIEALRRRFPRAPVWGQAGAYRGGDVSDVEPPAGPSQEDLGVAQGSVGPVHEPTVQNVCEGLQQLQEAACVDSLSSRVMGERLSIIKNIVVTIQYSSVLSSKHSSDILLFPIACLLVLFDSSSLQKLPCDGIQCC